MNLCRRGLVESLSMPPVSNTKAAHGDHGGGSTVPCPSRRRGLAKALPIAIATAFVGVCGHPDTSSAAVGTLHELQDTNAFLQGVRIKVSDKSQQDAMIEFLTQGFDCRVLRKRIQGSVEETWLGFGPETVNVPTGWVPGVSSFGEYGGHASIALVYDGSSRSALYRPGESAPGDNIAYLQLAVPGYRISRMTTAGGNIIDAYGHVDVVSPSGVPMRGVVGSVPDPIMLVAVNCVDVAASKLFYERLGFVQFDVPYARPSKGATVFEPAPPSRAVYMSLSPNSMGVLLIPAEKRKKTLSVNPAFDSLHIVYNPSSDVGDDQVVGSDPLVDPSGVAVVFQSVAAFQEEGKRTR